MKVLMVGDITGRPGRRILARFLPNLRQKHGVDFVIANGENAAGGTGLTRATAEEIFACGVDVITGGNHTWHHREIYEFLESHPKVLRPANYPPGAPGRGSLVAQGRRGHRVGVVNLQGRGFMQELEDPFRVGLQEVEKLREETPLIFVDIHAEATSEKMALAWFLDGRVSAVLGTHTHVQTADERILPGGTAYITDVGMTGPRDGIIGMEREEVIQRFLTQLPVRFQVAKGTAQLDAVLVEVDEETGKALGIQRIHLVEGTGE